MYAEDAYYIENLVYEKIWNTLKYFKMFIDPFLSTIECLFSHVFIYWFIKSSPENVMCGGRLFWVSMFEMSSFAK